MAVEMEAGASIELPFEYEERAVHAVAGEVDIAGSPLPPRHLAVVMAERSTRVSARTASRLMILGGSPLEGERFIWWNFVASARNLIDEAAERWRRGAFPGVPGESEFIPLPEDHGPRTTFVP
jgi:redox-sensitive bicupin YhaK (pirin superfamily)